MAQDKKQDSQPDLTSSGQIPVKEEEEDFGELEVLPGYRFYTPDSKENIILDIDVSAMVEGARPSIRAATLEKLIERLTHEKFPGNGHINIDKQYPDKNFNVVITDPQLVNTFLLTYRTFSTGREVLDLLAMRFNVPRPVNTELQEKYNNSKVTPIRLRVFNVLKTWVDKYFHDCVSDQVLPLSSLHLAISLSHTSRVVLGVPGSF